MSLTAIVLCRKGYNNNENNFGVVEKPWKPRIWELLLSSLFFVERTRYNGHTAMMTFVKHLKSSVKSVKYLFSHIKTGIIIFIFVFLFSSTSLALTYPVGHLPVTVSAAIGQDYISLSGFIAPFASVVLTTDNIVMRSMAADSSGNFSISQVLVKQGFTHFCLTAVDVKRLGESEACITIPPVTGPYTKSNIFLPPTIGLFRTQISAGSNAIIWGYSMPGALVTVHSSDGKEYMATADKSGFYQITTRIDKAGSYDMYATAQLNKKPSEQPTNKVTLIALTLSQQVNKQFSNWLKNLLTFLYNLPLGPLWLAIPILILIYILWRKLRGKPLFPTFTPGKGKEKLSFDYLFRPRKLHHAWMKGVGY